MHGIFISSMKVLIIEVVMNLEFFFYFSALQSPLSSRCDSDLGDKPSFLVQENSLSSDQENLLVIVRYTHNLFVTHTTMLVAFQQSMFKIFSNYRKLINQNHFKMFSRYYRNNKLVDLYNTLPKIQHYYQYYST